MEALKEKIKTAFDSVQDKLVMVDNPLERRFMFMAGSKEILSLSLTEIKSLPDFIRKLFTIREKNTEEILSSMQKWINNR